MPIFSTILSNSRGCVMLAKTESHSNLKERGYTDGVFLSIRPDELRIDIRGLYADVNSDDFPQPHNGAKDVLMPGVTDDALWSLLEQSPNYDSDETRAYEKAHVEAMFAPNGLIPEEISKGAVGDNDGTYRYSTTGIDITSIPIVDYTNPLWNILDFGSDSLNRRVTTVMAEVRQLSIK